MTIESRAGDKQMDEHQTTAFGALREAHTLLRSVLNDAKNQTHPLTVADDVMMLLVEANQRVLAALRDMEH